MILSLSCFVARFVPMNPREIDICLQCNCPCEKNFCTDTAYEDAYGLRTNVSVDFCLLHQSSNTFCFKSVQVNKA